MSGKSCASGYGHVPHTPFKAGLARINVIGKQYAPTRDSHRIKYSKQSLHKEDVPNFCCKGETHECKRHEQGAPEHKQELVPFTIMFIHPTRQWYGSK